jgi:hypothetical protein
MRSNSKRSMWLILVAVLVLLVAACNGDDAEKAAIDTDQSTERASTEQPLPPAGAVDEDAGSNPSEAEGALGGDWSSDTDTGVVQVALQAADLGRDIIYRAEMTVAVTDVAVAGTDAMGIVESLGGYLYGQQTTGAPNPVSVLTFKVLPDDFQEALRRLGELGEIRTQNVSADDVTERIVDLESRISTAETSVSRLRDLLEGATDLEDVALLESQLLDRETTLETLRGQLRTVRDQVDLATVVLTLTEALSNPAVDLSVTAYPGHDEGASCPESSYLSVEEGEDATLCFEITNAGDTPLTSLELTDSVLDLELGDLVVVFGDPNGTLEPGQNTRTKVTATPVDQEGHPVEGRAADTTVEFLLDTTDPGGLPGFRDGLSASWSMLKTVGGAVVVTAGWLLPLLWVFVLAGLFLLWRSRRRRSPEHDDQGQAGEPR